MCGARRAADGGDDQGEINVDQAHRGYDIVNDATGKSYFNPF